MPYLKPNIKVKANKELCYSIEVELPLVIEIGEVRMGRADGPDGKMTDKYEVEDFDIDDIYLDIRKGLVLSPSLQTWIQEEYLDNNREFTDFVIESLESADII